MKVNLCCFMTFGLLLTSIAKASTPLGVNWFSIVEKQSDGVFLQIAHLYLGAGDRRAFFELEGCSAETPMLEVIENEDGVRYFSEFKLEYCAFSSDVRLNMFFEEDSGKLLHISSYGSETGYVASNDIEIFSSVCEGQELIFSGQIPFRLQGSMIDVQVANGENTSSLGSFKVLKGHSFRFNHDIREWPCEDITDLLVGSGRYLF